jgi:lysophospholipase L1-like esterase
MARAGSLAKGMTAAALTFGLLMSGCEDNGGPVNADPGNNDVNVYVAIGDSFTEGDDAPFPPYPPRLAALIGKTVINVGQNGETAEEGASRVGGVLARHRPGFLLILHGINGVLRRGGPDAAIAAVQSIVRAAKANKTVPVVATYPLPVGVHRGFREFVRDLNGRLRSMASGEHAPLVDLASAFGEDDAALLTEDGLHPSDEGTQLIAETFARSLH